LDEALSAPPPRGIPAPRLERLIPSADGFAPSTHSQTEVALHPSLGYRSEVHIYLISKTIGDVSMRNCALLAAVAMTAVLIGAGSAIGEDAPPAWAYPFAPMERRLPTTACLDTCRIAKPLSRCRRLVILFFRRIGTRKITRRCQPS